MSFGGILATALAGGAGVIGKQAGDDIADQRKAELLKQQADIEFQTQQRVAEMRQRLDRDQTLWKTQGEGGTATLDFSRRDIEQRNDLAIKGKVAEATNPELAAAKDAQAEAELQRDIRKINATAKPEAEKAAAIAEARARMEAKYRKADPTVASKVAEMEKALGRKLTEAELLQATGLAKTLDRETGYETVEQKEYDANGQEIRKTTRKEPIKAGLAGIKLDATKTGGAPPVGTEVSGYVFKGGDPNDKKNWAPKGAAKPAASPSMLKTQPLDMEGITFAGDGYKVNGQTYPTLDEARKARDASKTRSNSPMTQSLSRYGDD